MPDIQAWLKLMKILLLITSSWRWRRWRWWRIFIIPFRCNGLEEHLGIGHILLGTRKQEHIENYGQYGQMNFFHLYEILRFNKRGGRSDFPEPFYFWATLELWSTPLLFLESESCKRPYRLLSNGPYTGRITAFHKNEFSRKAMLATHSGIHFLRQSKLKC